VLAAGLDGVGDAGAAVRVDGVDERRPAEPVGHHLRSLTRVLSRLEVAGDPPAGLREGRPRGRVRDEACVEVVGGVGLAGHEFAPVLDAAD